jgi:gamma-glutamyltranspeptidase/glutathione hydrolase
VTQPPAPTPRFPDRLSSGQIVSKPPVFGGGGAVASQSRVAAEAGARILAQGGNAVDAAIATSLAVGVAEPWMSGLGGGALCLLQSSAGGAPEAYDFGMPSPKGLRLEDYPLDPAGGTAGDLFPWPKVTGDANLLGAKAVGLPGLPAGLALLHEKHGSIPWKRLFEPAIELAEEGLPVDWFALVQIANGIEGMERDPGCRAVFLDEAGRAPHPVAVRPLCKNPALVKTLKQLAAEGMAGFYEGALARSIVKDLQALGGRMSLEDLSGYRPLAFKAAEARLGGGRIWVLPELNGGPTIVQALSAVQEELGPACGGAPTPAFFAAFAKAMTAAFAERLERLGDQEGRRGLESCTTHISVVDGRGNLVALTQTLLSVFGSKVLLPESGLLMNNAVVWFDPEPGKPNSLGAGKRPLCNYVPLIGEGMAPGRGERRFAIGGSGGRRIIPAVAQLAAFLLAQGLDLEDAMLLPRLDASYARGVGADPRIGEETLAALAQADVPVTLQRWGPFPNNFAILGAALLEEGEACAAADPYHPWAEAVAAP